MLYLRFVVCLAVGLFGVSMVMSTLMDALLSDWDVVDEMRKFVAGLSKKQHSRVIGAETLEGAPERLSTRMQPQDRPNKPQGKPFERLSIGVAVPQDAGNLPEPEPEPQI
jgi:hypothetical protein